MRVRQGGPPRPRPARRCPRCCRGPGPDRRQGGAESRALLLPPHTRGLGRPQLLPALATAGPSGWAGGAGAPVRVRERCLPLPRPALLRGPGRRGLSGGAAPRERQVRRHPTQGQRARGREPRRVCPPRAPGRACDLGGTTPCPQWPRTDPQRARREGPRHARLVPLADPGGRKASSLFTPPQPRTDGRPGDSDSHRWSLCGDAPPPARPD